MSTGYPPPPRSGSSLPLIAAGAALVMTGYLVWDRFGSGTTVRIEPRTITPRGELADFEKATIAVYEESRPSVVHITTSRRVRTSMFTVERVPQGSGSGFFWDAEGHVVTNFHVIRDTNRGDIRIRTSDQSEVGAEVVDFSADHDIAVLRLTEKPKTLREIPLGTSSDLRVGQSVFAIGNPFGLDQTLTTGVISALDRSILSVTRSPIRGVIQIDAAINPGNSGGPLLDSAGRLIGMNTAIYSKSGDSAGIGFAVPVDTIRDVVTELLDRSVGSPTSEREGILGVNGVTAYLPRQFGYKSGAAVVRVVEGFGAAEAGLRAYDLSDAGELMGMGDVIVEVDGAPVATWPELVERMRGRKSGDVAQLKVLREFVDKVRIEEISVRLKPR